MAAAIVERRIARLGARQREVGAAKPDVYVWRGDNSFFANFAKGYGTIWCQMVLVTAFGVFYMRQAIGTVPGSLLEAGRIDDIPAPPLALDYWNLPDNARLSHAVVAIREDEAIHRDINHAFADALASGKDLPDLPSGRH